MVFYLVFLSDKRQSCYRTLTNGLFIYKELFKLTSAISCPLYIMLISSKWLLQCLKLLTFVWSDTAFMVSLVCEYLLWWKPVKNGQSVLKSCQGKAKKIWHVATLSKFYFLFIHHFYLLNFDECGNVSHLGLVLLR